MFRRKAANLEKGCFVFWMAWWQLSDHWSGLMGTEATKELGFSKKNGLSYSIEWVVLACLQPVYHPPALQLPAISSHLKSHKCCARCTFPKARLQALSAASKLERHARGSTQMQMRRPDNICDSLKHHCSGRVTWCLTFTVPPCSARSCKSAHCGNWQWVRIY